MEGLLTVERDFWEIVPVHKPAYPLHENLVDAQRCCTELLLFSRGLSIQQAPLARLVLEKVKRMEAYIYSTKRPSGKYTTRSSKLTGDGSVNLPTTRQITDQKAARAARVAKHEAPVTQHAVTD